MTKPGEGRWQSALTIAASYVVGGLTPLAPYVLVDNILIVLWVSVGVTLTALFLFGYVKGRFTGINAPSPGFR